VNIGLLERLVGNLDAEDIGKLMEEVDMQQMLVELGPYIGSELGPHLEDIKQDAQGQNGEAVHEFYERLPSGEQQEVFDETIADLISVVRECRERPDVGLSKLKSRVRDPDVFEPLLLVFQNDGHIDPEYSEELKTFARATVTWAGASIIPEAYTETELEELESRLRGE